ncbi:MAG: DNA translocase FtsK 4TM domain-containing protein, partial [Leptospiraceae bacterium]|nr:DNA translocase FtsK 4TM domain-containing protein [Leptospiraceae bacterium]
MAGLVTKNPSTKKKEPEKLKLESYLSLIFLFLSLFTAFSLFSYDDGEYGSQNNLFGKIGHFMSWLLFFFLGRSAFQIPFFLFGFGILFFQKKDANLKNLLYGLGVLLISGAIFANLFEREISSLKHGGGKLGTWTSELLEYFVGKSGRVLLALAAYIFGVIVILKETPKKFNKEFWLLHFYKIKEGFLRAMIPKPNIASEIKDGTKETSLKGYDLPWIEIKKVPEDWKFATSNTLTNETNFRISTIEVEEETSPNILEKTKNFFESVKSIQPITKIFKKTEPKETPKEEPKAESLQPETEEPPIQLPEISKTLKEKIYGAPLPSTETMEAVQIPEEVSKDKAEQKVISEVEEHITAEELEIIFANDTTDVHEITQTETQETTQQTTETVPSNFEELVEAAEKENLAEEQKAKELGEEKAKRIPLFKTTVPAINFLRKTQYKISHKHLATNLEKKPNPMFRLEAEYTARKIEEIIKEYGYESKVVTWQKGPIITRYEVAPPSGVKLGRITSLSDELKLYLAVKSIRIVAPIPGKSTIGIEVPNKFREQVLLGDILREKPESIPNGDLLITLGKDSISGETVYIDLNKLPHLLIAGTTGSGKSVSLNSMISYLIMTKSPNEVRFVMIDPKMVEMSLYENIPHLLMPVITDPRKAT